jgi:hypothetical protein
MLDAARTPCVSFASVAAVIGLPTVGGVTMFEGGDAM